MASGQTGQSTPGKRKKVLGWFRKESKSVEHPAPTPPAAKTPGSLWDEAYEGLRKETENLVKQYEDRVRLVLKDPQADPSCKEQLDLVIAHGLKRAEEERLRIAGYSIQEGLAKAAEIVEWAKEWIDQAVEASPQASTAWSIISLGIPFLTYPASAEKDCKEGFAYTISRMRYYITLEHSIMELGGHVKPTIIDFYKTVLDFQIRSVLRFYRSSLTTFAKDIVKLEDWKGKLETLKTKEEQLYRDSLQSSSLAIRDKLDDLATKANKIDEKMKNLITVIEKQSEIQIAVRDNTKEAVQQQKELLQHVVTKDEQKCLQRFRVSYESSDHDQSYEAYKKRNSCRVEGTCLWFLNHANFKEWLARDSGPLFVTADPGCGKSVLSAYLIDDVLPQPVCYFFFKDQVQDQAHQALCALLHQLLSKQPALIRLVKPACDSNGLGLVKNATVLWELFCKVVDSFGPLTIVLDALDECNEKDRKHLLPDLRKFLSRTKAKFLLTSRPYEQITGKLRGLVRDFPNIRIPGEELSEEISPEIDLVIKARVVELADEMQLKDSLRDHIEARLLKVPQRTYLWVYLVLEYIQAGFKKTPEGFDEQIQHLPESVNDAYESILLQGGPSSVQSRGRTVLNLVLGARRTLRIEELQIALELARKPLTKSISELQLEDLLEFKRTLREDCGLMLTFQDDEVYFLHQTVREFLLGSCDKTSWRGSFDLDSANGVCTAFCVNYLSLSDTRPTAQNGRLVDFSDERNGEEIEESSDSGNWNFPVSFIVDDWDSTLLREVFRPLRQDIQSYIASHWVTHFRMYQQHGSQSEDLNEKVLKLSRPPTEPYNVHISARDNTGGTIFHCLAKSGKAARLKDATEILVLASESGVDSSARDDQGFTCCHLAVLAGLEGIQKQSFYDYHFTLTLLCIWGADMDISDNNGKTPLHLSVGIPIFELGSLRNQTEEVYPRVLAPHLTAEAYKKLHGMVQTLLNWGANPNILDQDDRTPLHLLILNHGKHLASGVEVLARRLIDAGTNIESKDKDGRTAFDYAIASNNKMVIKLLEDVGAKAKTGSTAIS